MATKVEQRSASFTTSEVNVYNLVDVMVQKGWHVDPLLSPAAARVPISLSMCEEGVLDHFLEDLEMAICNLKSMEPAEKLGTTASFYQMLQKVNDKTLVDELSLIRLAAHYSIPPPAERRSLRTLSVEGRKLSMLGATGDMGKKLEELRRGFQKEKEAKQEALKNENSEEK